MAEKKDQKKLDDILFIDVDSLEEEENVNEEIEQEDPFADILEPVEDEAPPANIEEDEEAEQEEEEARDPYSTPENSPTLRLQYMSVDNGLPKPKRVSEEDWRDYLRRRFLRRHHSYRRQRFGRYNLPGTPPTSSDDSE